MHTTIYCTVQFSVATKHQKTRGNTLEEFGIFGNFMNKVRSILEFHFRYSINKPLIKNGLQMLTYFHSGNHFNAFEKDFQLWQLNQENMFH